MGIGGVVDTGITNFINVLLFPVSIMGKCWHWHRDLHNVTSGHSIYYLGTGVSSVSL